MILIQEKNLYWTAAVFAGMHFIQGRDYECNFFKILILEWSHTFLETWKHRFELGNITLILEKSPSTWKQVKIQMILSFQASSDVSMLIVMFLKLIFVSKLITVFPSKQMIISYWFASKWKNFRKISRFRNNKKVRVIRTQLFSIDRD